MHGRTAGVVTAAAPLLPFPHMSTQHPDVVRLGTAAALCIGIPADASRNFCCSLRYSL